MFLSTHSKRLSLRSFTDSDAELFVVWDIDKRVQEYMPEPHTQETSIEEQLEYIAECRDSEDELHAMLVDNETGTAIGTIAITEISDYHGIGEIGIVIGNTEYWSKGYATEAVHALLDYLKDNTKLRRILAECEADNVGVRKALEKCGFELECISKQSRIKNCSPIDTARYIKFL